MSWLDEGHSHSQPPVGTGAGSTITMVDIIRQIEQLDARTLKPSQMDSAVIIIEHVQKRTLESLDELRAREAALAIREATVTEQEQVLKAKARALGLLPMPVKRGWF